MFKLYLTLGMWIVALIVALANGFAGSYFWRPMYGEYINHLIKVAIFIPVMLMLSYAHARKTVGSEAYSSGWKTGIIFIRGAAWNMAVKKVLQTYNILEGQLWLLVILTALLAPPFFAKKLEK